MNPDGTQDINLHSFNGPGDNDVDLSMGELGTANPNPDWSDTLKLTSELHNFALTCSGIYGGKEDCVDINNRSTNIRVHAGIWKPQGLFAATVKGGSRGVHLSGLLVAHGREMDIDLGNKSDQSKETTGGVVLDIRSVTGRPVRVRVLIADKPTLIEGSGPYEYAFPKPDAWYHGIVVWFFKTFY